MPRLDRGIHVQAWGDAPGLAMDPAVKPRGDNRQLTRALQTQTRAELDTLLPSILDRAFKGEL
jgi:hypothetical protein